jgi:death-on-curing protein
MSDLRPWDDLLSLPDVYELYREGIRRYGGDPSDPKPGCVDGSLGAAWNAESYSDPDPGRLPGLAFAGYLLFYLSRNHCFTDGNKRLAWSTAMHVLLHHGLTVEATVDDAEQLMLSVIAGRIDDGMDVVNWLAERLVAAEAVMPS